MKPIALLASAYLAPVQHYAKLYAYSEVRFEACEHYVKQTWRNRCLIASPSGVQVLTVPVAKPVAGKCLMKDVRISDHGNWRRMHWNALETAYRNSPFFDYYADDFLPFYTRRWDFLFDFNEAIRATVCELLDLHPKTSRTISWNATVDDADDLRQWADPARDVANDPTFVPRAYWQVFSSRWGFLPNLSIADLLFNMGPEALLVLNDCVRKDA